MNYYINTKTFAIEYAKNTIIRGEKWLNTRPIQDEKIDIPPYYSVDPDYYEGLVGHIENDCNIALECAYISRFPIENELRKKASEISLSIINSWANVNKGAINREGKFIVLYNCQALVHAYLMLRENDLDVHFPESVSVWNWVREYFLPIAKEFKDRWFGQNNQASWGWLGYILSKVLLQESITEKDGQAYPRFLKNQIDAKTGKMKKEVRRTYSGIWYWYFSLLPLYRTSLLFSRYYNIIHFYHVHKALDWMKLYLLDPPSWPYKPWPWIFGKIQNIIWPHTDELEVPHEPHFLWPSDLLEIADSLDYKNDWIKDYISWPVNSGHIFRASSAIIAFDLQTIIF